MPPVSRKHGRPLGSRNKKSLAALAAAAAAVSAEAAPAAATDAVSAKAAAAATTAAASIGRLLPRPPVTRLALLPARLASIGARQRSSGSPTLWRTVTLPSWPLFGLGARCACHSPSGSLTRWEGTC
jgi:hypothetical protein